MFLHVIPHKQEGTHDVVMVQVAMATLSLAFSAVMVYNDGLLPCKEVRLGMVAQMPAPDVLAWCDILHVCQRRPRFMSTT
jgi:hypothetical protein